MKPTATLLILSLLWGSLDGAADIASSGHAHQPDGAPSAVVDLTEPQDATVMAGDDQSRQAGPEDDSHCEHCCHGHTHAVVALLSLSSMKPTVEHTVQPVQVSDTDARAPPTPPPNA